MTITRKKMKPLTAPSSEDITVTMTRTNWLHIIGHLSATAYRMDVNTPEQRHLSREVHEIGRQYAAGCEKLDQAVPKRTSE